MSKAVAADDRKELEDLILHTLDKHDTIPNSLDFLTQHNLPLSQHQLLISTLQSLQSHTLVTLTSTDTTDHILTAEGEDSETKGTPEGRLIQQLTSSSGGSGKTMKELEGLLGKEVLAIGQAQGMKGKWLQLDKASGELRLKEGVEVKDDVQELLRRVKEGKSKDIDAKVLTELKKRKMIVQSTTKTYSVSKGAEFSLERKQQLTDLTADILRTAQWQSSTFKQYNFSALGTPPSTGSLHPLMKVRSEFRRILFEMGFEEMPTDNYVESSYWNFDALFQPQQHPARDSHDTFFLHRPATARSLPTEYMARVKRMHEVGGEGSIGYRYEWKQEEAAKNILRTHTTAVSTRMLHHLAQQAKFIPKKYFSIDRVFRNETLDATHLAEFHQVEGLIADRGLSLGDLLGTIQYFFMRLGISNVKFKPAYNPYTEPSMEIFGYSEQLGKWIEVGNSGMFRPEMLRPMGLDEDVRVIAWGLSLERPTMIKYGVRNIRDLFGPKVKIDLIQQQGIARFDD